MNETQSQTGMITTPEGLFDFAGIADQETQKDVAVHVALIGMHAATISMLEGQGADSDDEEIKEHAMGTAENFEELGKLLTSYDIRLSMVPQLQILFFVQSTSPLELATSKIESFEGFLATKENKAILPLTAGIINEFSEAGGGFDDDEEDEEL